MQGALAETRPQQAQDVGVPQLPHHITIISVWLGGEQGEGEGTVLGATWKLQGGGGGDSARCYVETARYKVQQHETRPQQAQDVGVPQLPHHITIISVWLGGEQGEGEGTVLGATWKLQGGGGGDSARCYVETARYKVQQHETRPQQAQDVGVPQLPHHITIISVWLGGEQGEGEGTVLGATWKLQGGGGGDSARCYVETARYKVQQHETRPQQAQDVGVPQLPHHITIISVWLGGEQGEGEGTVLGATWKLQGGGGGDSARCYVETARYKVQQHETRPQQAQDVGVPQLPHHITIISVWLGGEQGEGEGTVLGATWKLQGGGGGDSARCYVETARYKVQQHETRPQQAQDVGVPQLPHHITIISVWLGGEQGEGEGTVLGATWKLQGGGGGDSARCYVETARYKVQQHETRPQQAQDVGVPQLPHHITIISVWLGGEQGEGEGTVLGATWKLQGGGGGDSARCYVETARYKVQQHETRPQQAQDVGVPQLPHHITIISVWLGGEQGEGEGTVLGATWKLQGGGGGDSARCYVETARYKVQQHETRPQQAQDVGVPQLPHHITIISVWLGGEQGEGEGTVLGATWKLQGGGGGDSARCYVETARYKVQQHETRPQQAQDVGVPQLPHHITIISVWLGGEQGEGEGTVLGATWKLQGGGGGDSARCYVETARYKVQQHETRPQQAQDVGVPQLPHHITIISVWLGGEQGEGEGTVLGATWKLQGGGGGDSARCYVETARYKVQQHETRPQQAQDVGVPQLPHHITIISVWLGGEQGEGEGTVLGATWKLQGGGGGDSARCYVETARYKVQQHETRPQQAQDVGVPQLPHHITIISVWLGGEQGEGEGTVLGATWKLQGGGGGDSARCYVETARYKVQQHETRPQQAQDVGVPQLPHHITIISVWLGGEQGEGEGTVLGATWKLQGGGGGDSARCYVETARYKVQQHETRPQQAQDVGVPQLPHHITIISVWLGGEQGEGEGTVLGATWKLQGGGGGDSARCYVETARYKVQQHETRPQQAQDVGVPQLPHHITIISVWLGGEQGEGEGTVLGATWKLQGGGGGDSARCYVETARYKVQQHETRPQQAQDVGVPQLPHHITIISVWLGGEQGEGEGTVLGATWKLQGGGGGDSARCYVETARYKVQQHETRPQQAQDVGVPQLPHHITIISVWLGGEQGEGEGTVLGATWKLQGGGGGDSARCYVETARYKVQQHETRPQQAQDVGVPQLPHHITIISVWLGGEQGEGEGTVLGATWKLQGGGGGDSARCYVETARYKVQQHETRPQQAQDVGVPQLPHHITIISVWLGGEQGEGEGTVLGATWKLQGGGGGDSARCYVETARYKVQQHETRPQQAQDVGVPQLPHHITIISVWLGGEQGEGEGTVLGATWKLQGGGGGDSARCYVETARYKVQQHETRPQQAQDVGVPQLPHHITIISVWLGGEQGEGEGTVLGATWKLQGTRCRSFPITSPSSLSGWVG
ncbi:unnamed protein product [Closterium sp. Naga37s-1]|nr:unnamed protein product [Closterium sp. Naga37s-1]